MHGQPGHTPQVSCSTLTDVIIVAAEVLVRELRHKQKVNHEKLLFFFFTQPLSGHVILTASPSLHFQLPLSRGFLRFSPIQNQCCSWSSDSLRATSSSSSPPPLSSHYDARRPVRRSHPPEGLVKDLQNEVLLFGAADAQQVGAVLLTEQVSLRPAQLLLHLGGMKHLHTGDTGGLFQSKQHDEHCVMFHTEAVGFHYCECGRT